MALMCFGGLRRSEIVALDVGDVAPGLGLRRVQGKGGAETAVPLPKIAQDILAHYLATERGNATAIDPLFVSRFKTKGGHVTEVRMKGHRVWKITKAMACVRACPRFTRTRSATRLVSSCSGSVAGISARYRNISGTPTFRRRRCIRG